MAQLLKSVNPRLFFPYKVASQFYFIYFTIEIEMCPAKCQCACVNVRARVCPKLWPTSWELLSVVWCRAQRLLIGLDFEPHFRQVRPVPPLVCNPSVISNQSLAKWFQRVMTKRVVSEHPNIFQLLGTTQVSRSTLCDFIKDGGEKYKESSNVPHTPQLFATVSVHWDLCTIVQVFAETHLLGSSCVGASNLYIVVVHTPS